MHAIEALVPWHDKSLLMVKEYCQFSSAVAQSWEADMFFKDPKLGTYGIDSKVPAAVGCGAKMRKPKGKQAHY